MAKLIGGIAHGKIIPASAHWLIIPVFANNRQPKQEIVAHFTQAKYERTNIIRDGEVIYRFVAGYYPPPNTACTGLAPAGAQASEGSTGASQ